MPRKPRFYFIGVCYLVYGLVFASLTVRLVFSEAAPAFTPLSAAGILIVLAFAARLLETHENTLRKYYRTILVSFLGVLLSVQLLNATMLRFEPAWDLGAVYRGAVAWAETGSFADYHEYFYFFPNNLGSLMLMASIFRAAHAIGITDYFMVASVVTSILSCAAVLTTASLCRRLLGTWHAVFSLLLFGGYLPIWFTAPAFYTDALSMLFPVLILFSYYKALACQTKRQKILYLIILGIAAALGTLIKATVLIAVIAVVIDGLTRRLYRLTCLLAASAVLLIGAGFAIQQAVIYPNHLKQETAAQNNTPYLHWVMMGLKGDGGYSPDDYVYTRSFSDTEARDAALRDEIQRRMTDLGPNGLYKLFWAKTLRSFGSGTLQQSDFLDDSPVNRTVLHEYLLYDGQNYAVYRGACYAVFATALALAACSGLQEVFSRRQLPADQNGSGDRGRAVGSSKHPTWNYLAPRLSLLGILLFLAGWETSGRYITNYVPVIMLCAVLGISSWRRALKSVAQRSIFSRSRQCGANNTESCAVLTCSEEKPPGPQTSV